MSFVTGIFTTLFNGVFALFGNAQTLALSVISAMVGVAMMFLWKVLTDQKKLQRILAIRDARILEMRLYQDDAVVILKAFGGALAMIPRYLWSCSRAVIVLLMLALLVIVQLDQRFGARAFEVGERALLTVTLKDGADPMRVPMSLESEAGVNIDSRAVRSSIDRSSTWRIAIQTNGVHNMTVKAYDKTYTFPIFAEDNLRPIGRKRVANSFSDGLIHIGLPELPKDAPIQSVALQYPTRNYSLFGWMTDWFYVFLVWTMIGALIPKFLFGIKI